MCLILFGWQAHRDYALVLAANRDEFHSRPSLPLAPWPGAPQVLGGLDQRAGGTWLGVTRSGRFAAVTNYRDPSQFEQQRSSRGLLTRDYLLGDLSAHQYLEDLLPRLPDYLDFNLLVGDAQQAYCLESRTGTLIPLRPGVYGLSNHLLDTPWPKVVDGKERLTQAMGQATTQDRLTESLFALLGDDRPYPDEQLPETGIPLERERLISAAFIRDPLYGTRCSSVLLLAPTGNGLIAERRFTPEGEPAGQSGIMFGS